MNQKLYERPVYEEPVVIDYPVKNRLDYFGIPKRFKSATWDFIRTHSDVNDRARLDKLKLLKEYSDNFRDYLDCGIGLLLKGGVGTGKTTIAIAVLRDYIDNGGRGYFISAVTLMDEIYSITDFTDRARFENKLRSVPVLIIDDLGAEGTGDAVSRKIAAIINTRYNDGLVTIVTTNLGADDLKTVYDARTYDRLKASCKVFNIVGESLRKGVN